MDSFWNALFWGNTVKDWLIALGIIIAACFLARIAQKVVLSRMVKLAARTSSTVDDFIVSLVQRAMPLVYLLAIYFGLHYLTLGVRVQQIMHTAILAITVFYVIRMIGDIMGYFFERFAKTDKADPTQNKQAKGILLILKVILWVIGIIFLIDNLGYDITTVITGLGIGGIAIALAAQAVLGDLFSYLVIFFDKPFETGDFIILGETSGVVEYIGIKTTRLRSLGGEQLIVSNSDMTNSRVQNFKRMEKRRVLFSIGVTYDTSAAKMRKIPELVKGTIDGREDVQFDRVHFKQFGDFSLQFEIVYYILTADYVRFMDIQQEVCLSIFEIFEKEEIEFAFPTQTILLSGQNGTDKGKTLQNKLSFKDNDN